MYDRKFYVPELRKERDRLQEKSDHSEPSCEITHAPLEGNAGSIKLST